MLFERRNHQKLAIANVLTGFKKYDRGQLIMACGTGKTVTGLWIKEDLDANRTLVLVPSIALVDQFASEWRKRQAPDRGYATLCVCSDNTVGRSADNDSDEIQFTTDDLVRDGFDVTSDQERIGAFLKQDGRQVIFSTYQSSHLIAQAQEDESVPAFDLAIADEAHRCAGDENSIFATILKGDRIRAEKRLFATATPRIYRLKKGQEDTGTDIVDMNDEAQFGPRFHTLTFGDAIKQDLLSDYRVVIMLIDDSDIQSVLAKNDDKHKLLRAAQVGLLKTIRQFGLRRVISFHSYVKNANEFAQSLPAVSTAMWHDDPEAGQPMADSVSGDMTARVRKEKLDAFRSTEEGQYRILTNARCLTEGVDVPDIDGIAFIDPRSSHIDIIQALGRAIRKHETKTHGTIILPVFLGKGENPAEVIENSNFKPVMDVLSALRSHDADFETALNEWRQIEGGAKSGEADPFSKIQIVGTEQIIEFTKVIHPSIIEELTDNFEVGFGAMSAYHAVKGHCNVPIRTTWPEDDPDGFKLGQWVSHRRAEKELMPPKRVERLEALGFVWNAPEANFNNGFECLKAYNAAKGHCVVSRNATWPEDDPDGFYLGGWRRYQLRLFNQGKLSAERKQKLESIGMVFDPFEAAWEEGFACLQAYRAVHGHCNVPIRTTWPEDDPDGFKLSNWVKNKRSNRNNLTAERKQELESIGMVWDVLESNWEEGFACLQAYRAVHGHCNVPIRTTWPEDDPDGFKLGQWLQEQRKMFKLGNLTAERRQKLESIGMVWDVLESNWEEGFACLQAYRTAHGHCNVVPGTIFDGRELGIWVSNQRKRFKQDNLHTGRKQRLESIGFEFNPLAAKWLEAYVRLNVYRTEHGHCNVPFKWRCSDGFYLGLWFNKQLRLLKQGKLPADCVERLEIIGVMLDINLNCTLEDLIERLGDKQITDDIPEQMTQFGCDFEQSRALIEAGRYDEALELLAEATGESIPRLRM